MKKRLSFILAVVMTSALLYGCGGSSTDAAADVSKKTASTETAQASAQEETSEASDSAQEETGEATAPAQEETNEATAPAQGENNEAEAPAQAELAEAAEAPAASTASTASAESAEAEEASDTSTGFKIMSKTSTGRSGGRIDIENYDQDGDTIRAITNDDENKIYTVDIVEKQYDEDGKWIGSTIYSAQQETAIDIENTDIYKTEEKIVATGICTYDDNGFVEKVTDSSGNTFRIDTYNQQHQLIQRQIFFNNNEYDTSNTYDEQGVLIEQTTTSNTESGTPDTTTAQFTAIGVTPYQISTVSQGETISESEVKYDENGVPVGAVYSNNRTGESYEVTFELDEYGNLIRTETKDGDAVVSSVEYEIAP